MNAKLRLDLPVLLPDIPDARDACVSRMSELMVQKAGITEAHVVDEDGQDTLLCLHYDPNVVSVAQVERLARAAGAQITGNIGHAMLPLRAIDGEDAARRISNRLQGLDGVLNARVNLAAQRARVEFDRSSISEEQITAALRDMHYAPRSPKRSAGDAGGADETASEDTSPGSDSWYSENQELVWSLTAGLLLLVGWVGESFLGLPASLALGLFIGAYAFGGFDLVRHWVGTLREGRVTFDIDLLMLLAALGAGALGQWAEGAFLLFLFSLAHALEHYALGRARDAISSLAELAPTVARVLRDGREQEVPIKDVTTGDIVVVRPAERISVDGEVRAGDSSVNQAPITGESLPKEKGPGDQVFAGTVNGDGALEIITTAAAGDRTLDRVIKLVEEAQTQQAPTQRFTERFERIFVPTVLIADVLLIALPPLFGFWDLSTSFYRAMALLVAASPCALALGTPSAVLTGIAQAARRGVLIKGGAHLENLGTLRALAFDKTGTITIGKPEVTDLVPAQGVSEDTLLQITAAVEQRSQHPLADAVVRFAETRNLQLPEAGDLQSLTGRGVRSSVAGETVEVGNLRLWDQDNVAIPADIRAAAERLQASGRSVMVARQGSQWLGVLGVADQPRPGIREVLDTLRGLGIRTIIMLTGDNRGVGEAIAKEVGIDEVKAELLPEDKVAAMKELLDTHGQVAMVGDGVNDAPALANATVGIAMGGAGTAAALETADVVLMGDDLGRLPFVIGLSRQSRSVIRQNLYFSLGVVLLLILATVSGIAGIGWAVLIHESSTLVVIANALRLLVYGGDARSSLTTASSS